MRNRQAKVFHGHADIASMKIKPLSPFERWAVNSHLTNIRSGQVKAEAAKISPKVLEG